MVSLGVWLYSEYYGKTQNLLWFGHGTIRYERLRPTRKLVARSAQSTFDSTNPYECLYQIYADEHYSMYAFVCRPWVYDWHRWNCSECTQAVFYRFGFVEIKWAGGKTVEMLHDITQLFANGCYGNDWKRLEQLVQSFAKSTWKIWWCRANRNSHGWSGDYSQRWRKQYGRAIYRCVYLFGYSTCFCRRNFQYRFGLYGWHWWTYERCLPLFVGERSDTIV